MVQSGIPVEPVANRVVEAIKDNDLYIFTHVEFKPLVEMRFANIMAAFDKSEKSKALSVLSKRDLSSLAQQRLNETNLTPTHATLPIGPEHLGKAPKMAHARPSLAGRCAHNHLITGIPRRVSLGVLQLESLGDI